MAAIQAGFLLRQGDSVSFAHDRVQEAAYALIPEEERPGVHAHIGRKLLAHLGPEALGDNLFDVVNHLNRGAGLITDPSERVRVAGLNALAGRRARAAIAHATARDFFAAAGALLPEGAWELRYDFIFALYLDWVECEYLSGAFPEAERRFTLLLAQAKSVLDQAKVYELQLTLYPIEGKYDDALAVGLHALRLFGVEIPGDDAAINRELQAAAAAVAAHWRGRNIAELAAAPVAADPRIKAVIALLTGSGAPAYIGSRPQLFPLLNLKTVNYSLLHGPTKESCEAYSAYASQLAAVFGDPHAGYAFSDMAIKLSQRFNDPGARGAVLYLHGNHVNFWLHPFASDFPFLEQGFRLCRDAGNLVFANYIAYSIVWQAVERGDTLGTVLEFSKKYAGFALESRNGAIYHSIILEQQFVKCLLGKTDGSVSFSGDAVDERLCLEKISNASFTCGVMYYHTMKTLAAYLMGDDAAAQTHAEEAGKILAAAMGQPMAAMFTFLHALVLVRVCRATAVEGRGEILKTLAAHQEKLAFWAEHCPANFAGKYALVAAEIAGVEGHELAAGRLYEQAIASARANGFIHWEAMAHEAAARFYGGCGLTTAARAHVREARDCYGRWGAVPKVKQLEALHSWLTPVKRAAAPALAEQLDAVSLAKAQRAISGEIRQEHLARTLLRIVMENAGAQTGYLSVEGNGQLRAEMGPGDDSGQRIVFDDSPGQANLPREIINYVRRSRETVILADAGTAVGQFPADDYLRRVKPGSVLCLAIERQEKLLAVLYLENNLVAGAFTPERRLVLEVLAAQAAISLETAAVHAALQESEERLRLTLDATQIGTWDWDVEHDRWRASPVYYTMLGYPPKAGAGDREEWMARLHPDDRAIFVEKMDDVLFGNGVDYQYEARLRHADGTYRWQFVKGFSIKRDEAGKVTRMLGVRMDIHDRKQAEAERQSHLLFFENMDRIHRALQGASDLEQRLGDVLDVVLSVFGCDRAYLQYPCDPGAAVWRVPVERSRPCYPRVVDLGHDQPMEECLAAMHRLLLAADGPVQFGPDTPYPLPEALAHRFGLKSFMAVALYPGSGLPWVFGIHQCAAEARTWTPAEERLLHEIGRRLADSMTSLLMYRNLSESEQRFRTLVSQAADAFFVHDMEGRFLDVNRAACDSLGYAQEELLAMSVSEVDAEFISHDHVRNFWSKLTLDQAVTLEGRHKRKDGTTFPVEVRLGLLGIGDRQVILALVRDITERKSAEAALKQLNDELELRVRERTAELAQNNEDLERMNQLFVGRELRMIELKERIKALEKGNCG
jgi:PAS domain S-box-containing protein